MRALLALAASALALASCQTVSVPGMASVEHPEARAFDPAVTDSSYAARLDAAIAGLGEGEKALVVFGANWCHDSRALAGWLLDPAHAAQLAGLKPVFIDVGKPQDGKGRNLALVERFGIADLKSTPALVVVDAEGHRVNTLENAIAWRNAASRSDAEIAAAIANETK